MDFLGGFFDMGYQVADFADIRMALDLTVP